MHRGKGVTLRLMMLTLSMGLFLTPDSRAEEEFQPVYNPTLTVPRTTGNIRIDGQLDEPAWRDAGRATNFAEYQPGDQTKPPVDTEAFITYDDERLYVAFMCYDDPEVVRASLCEREQLSRDDNVGFFMDTYGEAAWAYLLNVNPYGIQADAMWTRSNGEDGSFDLVWESAGKITDSGYQVEMAIPFASLRFPNKPNQTWKVNFWRNHPRDSRRQYSWAAHERDNPCWLCQWGTISGIRDVQPGKGIEILPSVIGFQTGALAGDGTAEDPYVFENEDLDGEISIGAKYSISSDITAEVTYNPDFSQVESDPAQIDVNTPYALWYDERRPFFQEGSDLFRTWSSTVYTRSINDPQFAAKLTARMNGTSMAYLAARDENTPIILPLEESSTFLLTGKSLSHILRARRTLGEDTYLGAIITDRRLNDGGSGTVLSADGEIRFSQNFRLQWQLAGTHTEEPKDSMLNEQILELIGDSRIDSTFDSGVHTVEFDGESYWGHAMIANLEERSRHFNFDITYWEFSPTFRADNGYVDRNDARMTEVYTAYTFYPDNGIFDRITPYTRNGILWNFDGVRKDGWINLECETQLKGQTNLHTRFMWSSERVKGILFDDIWLVHQCGHSNFSDMLGLGFGLHYGNLVAGRREETPVMGREISLYGEANLKLADRIRIDPTIDYNRSENRDTGEEIFEGYITRTKLNYQLSRELSLRLVVQYDDFDKAWDVDPLMTYRLSPFSLFYIGSTYDYRDIEEDGGHVRNRELTSRQFFLKLQYLFQP